MGKRRSVIISTWEPPPEREKTVLLDQIGTGQTWGYERSEDGRMCSGELVEHRRDEQASQDLTWRNRWRV